MIIRLLGSVAAIAFTATTVIGIGALIAHDFDAFPLAYKWVQIWTKRPASAPAILGKSDALKGADNITFFKSVPIVGTKLKVTTGIAFGSTADVITGKSINRWCYIQLGSGSFTQKLDLGGQVGTKKPKYTDTTTFSREQLRIVGMGAAKLAEIARTHCLLGGFDPRKGGSITSQKRIPKENTKKKPAQVWNWQKPYSPYRSHKKERAV